MTPPIALVCLLSSILSVTPAADASVSYTYATAPTTLSAAPGSVGYDIFLHETLTDGSASIVAADGGVNGAAFRIERVSGSGVGISDLSFGPAFISSVNAKSVAASLATLYESTDAGVAAALLVSNRVLLGTAWFTGNGLAEFVIDRYDGFSGWVTTPVRSLDANPGDDSFAPLAGGHTFSVPEPTSIAALLPLLLFIRRHA